MDVATDDEQDPFGLHLGEPVAVQDDEADSEPSPFGLKLMMPRLGTGARSTECRLALGAELQLFDEDQWVGAPFAPAARGAHTDREGNFIEYDQIPRRWDRPDAYAAYRYPVPHAMVVSGFDLDKPDEQQRRGKNLSAVGHGGVDLAEKMGTPITMVPLDHQVGLAEVIYVGWLFGETVITRHTRREGGKKRDYIVLWGHLERAEDGIRPGRLVRAGETIAYVGNTGSAEFVHLHWEARRLREGVDPWKLGPLVKERGYSIPTDPRNVMALVAPKRKAPACAPPSFEAKRPAWLTFD